MNEKQWNNETSDNGINDNETIEVQENSDNGIYDNETIEVQESNDNGIHDIEATEVQESSDTNWNTSYSHQENANQFDVIHEQYVPMKQKKHKLRTDKKGLWKKTIAAVLTLAMITASAAGVSTITRLSTEMDKQAVLIHKLTEQVSTQNDALLQTQDLAAKVEALNNTSAAASLPKNLAATALLSGSSVTDIAKVAGPSVIGIRMTVAVSNRRFTANQQTSEGSGVIISSDGYIMTNYHVVSYADTKSGYSDTTTLEVFLPDGRSTKGKFVGGDSENDLAVIKIDLKDLPVAELGSSSVLQVGELAVAIGNPLGMEFAGSVTVGVVSALNRKIDGQESSLNLIQTDAAINPGNSGGALVNSKGQVVGINTVKISQTGVEGLGFAISMDDAKPIINSLIMYGYVKNRPYIGITGQDITDIMSSMYNVPVGIYVTDLDTTGGGYKAGIRVGDIITGIAGKTVVSMAELNAVKKGYQSGDTVNVNITRNSTKMSVKVTFTEAK